MSSRRNSPNRIKSHRNYTVIELSEALGVHPKTVRNWLRVGLPVADEKRPLLINGTDVKIYLKQKRKTYMHQCELDEMYCFKCKQPKKPNTESLQFFTKPAGMVQMMGRCIECGCKANKYVSSRDLKSICQKLNVKLPIAEKHIILRGNALLNCPLNTVLKDEKK
ncbi:helix-turn-helix domain-containing protein [Photobacterium leiognathi]|uniref:helix-turn-helix domain-containing protein n=1 Tax=Photobacterium leiognathi TaxID=553611 RepID=UPI001EDD09CD|nr:helix-turn-helix domain-containing protein [Photobacterium leiognathi]MCG3884712.1 helix-turn-helix domain-containing protein [Photobacterium leiognathi]